MGVFTVDDTMGVVTVDDTMGVVTVDDPRPRLSQLLNISLYIGLIHFCGGSMWPGSPQAAGIAAGGRGRFGIRRPWE